MLRHLDIGFQMAFLLKNLIKTAEDGLKTAEKNLGLKYAELRSLKANTKWAPEEAELIAKAILAFTTALNDAQLKYDQRYTLEGVNLKCYFE